MRKLTLGGAIMLVIGLGVWGVGASARSGVEEVSDLVFIDHDFRMIDGDLLYGSDIFDPDPLPETEFKELPKVFMEVFPNEHQLKLIGRLADGIVKDKRGMWWECGELLDQDDDIKDRSVFYAFEIVRALDVVFSDDSEDVFASKVWGLAGTIKNESNFDRCAFGLYPRRKAYEMGLIKPRRKCISHSEKEVLGAVRSESLQKYFKRSGFDLGTAQVLSRFYSNPRDYENMLSVRGSTMEAAYHMHAKVRVHRTDRPWAYWPGHRSRKYDRKVTKWARRLGAEYGEI